MQKQKIIRVFEETTVGPQRHSTYKEEAHQQDDWLGDETQAIGAVNMIAVKKGTGLLLRYGSILLELNNFQLHKKKKYND